MDRFQNKLVFFVIASYFYWLGQTRKLTMEFLHHESVFCIVQPLGHNKLECLSLPAHYNIFVGVYQSETP
jgi:hypothetical protein